MSVDHVGFKTVLSFACVWAERALVPRQLTALLLVAVETAASGVHAVAGGGGALEHPSVVVCLFTPLGVFCGLTKKFVVQ